MLCLVLFGVGSRTILTVDVTGNQALSAEEIIAQLRLCGVSVGTYAPSIPVREVENRMMLAMDQLHLFLPEPSRHPGGGHRPGAGGGAGPPAGGGTLRRGGGADGIITHIEPWAGDAQVHEGDAVCQGMCSSPG